MLLFSSFSIFWQERYADLLLFIMIHFIMAMSKFKNYNLTIILYIVLLVTHFKWELILLYLWLNYGDCF